MSEHWKVSGKKFDLPQASRVTFEVRPGGWVIFTDETGLRHRLSLRESRGALSASLGGFLFHGQVANDRVAGAANAGSDGDLVSQFPGKVRKVLVTENSVVAESDPLVLVEAMKMEFTIKAPFAGKITRVLVQEGQQLSPGDRFLELEPV